MAWSLSFENPPLEPTYEKPTYSKTTIEYGSRGQKDLVVAEIQQEELLCEHTGRLLCLELYVENLGRISNAAFVEFVVGRVLHPLCRTSFKRDSLLYQIANLYLELVQEDHPAKSWQKPVKDFTLALITEDGSTDPTLKYSFNI